MINHKETNDKGIVDRPPANTLILVFAQEPRANVGNCGPQDMANDLRWWAVTPVSLCRFFLLRSFVGGSMSPQSILLLVTAYLLGSIPFGRIIASAVARINITERGSGNIGATNVARELGLIWGLFTLLLDILKGFVPVFLFAHYASPGGYGHEIGLSAVGLSALLGHQFSIFMRFRGGKGVATAAGVYLGISIPACLLAAVIFVLTVYKWDIISVGSMASAVSMPLLLAVFGEPPPMVIGALLVAGLICLKHRGNIQRLLKGNERKWRSKKNQPSISSSLSSSSSE